MNIEVAEFKVTATPHPERSDKNLQWKVFICVKFKSNDSSNWGELRAYGGSWISKINRAKVRTGVRDEQRSQVLDPHDLTDIEDTHVLLNAMKNLPPWPKLYNPTYKKELLHMDLRLGNDQHVEIFYAKKVPNLLRSYPDAKNVKEPEYVAYDPMIDTAGYDDPQQAEHRDEIDLTKWHIIGRDEPQQYNYAESGDYIHYCHAAEFHIRPPGKVNVIAKKKLILYIMGKYGEFQYLPPIVE